MAGNSLISRNIFLSSIFLPILQHHADFRQPMQRCADSRECGRLRSRGSSGFAAADTLPRSE